jgi:DNA modification methylase
VFDAVRRVLADDGVLWLNLGDTYAANRAYQVSSTGLGAKVNRAQRVGGKGSVVPDGLKPKDLIGIPWRVAFALQAAGWYLRQDIIWHKPNPMPESVRDRCTKAHEYLFLLTKNERYYWDAEAMRERAVATDIGAMDGGAQRLPDGGNANDGRNFRSKRDSFKREGSKRAAVIPGQSVGTHRAEREESTHDVFTRNRRSVWTVATRPFKGAHFATYPEQLIEPCVAASTRPGDLVLDPFGGAGTTGLVALKQGRRAVMCELNSDYADIAERRIATAIYGQGFFG